MHRAVVLGVVEHRAVGPGADDGVVGDVPRSGMPERLLDRVLELELAHARPQHLEDPGVAGGGVLDGAAHELQLVGLLQLAQPAEGPVQIVDLAAVRAVEGLGVGQHHLGLGPGRRHEVLHEVEAAVRAGREQRAGAAPSCG